MSARKSCLCKNGKWKLIQETGTYIIPGWYTFVVSKHYRGNKRVLGTRPNVSLTLVTRRFLQVCLSAVRYTVVTDPLLSTVRGTVVTDHCLSIARDTWL